MGRIKKESSILILGILIVEDVIAVILISSLQSIALVGTVSIESVVVILLVAIGLIVGTFTIGTRVIPPLIDRVAAAEHREILLLSVLGLCFGYALFANIVGLSVAIGAFLAGVLVAESCDYHWSPSAHSFDICTYSVDCKVQYTGNTY